MARNHAFVSFTNRVAAIKIDPIRRTGRDRGSVDAKDNGSLFISALEKWNELNLATKFTQFSRQCRPLAQSLPMIIYNQSRIFELLIGSLEATDEHSIEPFLDLLVNFARDLGEDFEAFYAISLQTCIQLIQANQRKDELLETVELLFNCLAYLFKYLARLLTANLVPTYDIMLPLFGGVPGVKQRNFVLRFAAESMAFLIRRASKDSLANIIDHIASRVPDGSENEQFLVSSSKLLATALEGPQISLHSKAPALLEQYIDSCHRFNSCSLICYVLVEVLHHTRRDTSSRIYDVTVHYIREYKDTFGARCLYVLAGFRKGDRVNKWDDLYDALLSIPSSLGASWTRAASALITYADMLSTSKNLTKVLDNAESLEVIASIMITVHLLRPDVTRGTDKAFWQYICSRANTSSIKDLKLVSLVLLEVGSRNPEALLKLETQETVEHLVSASSNSAHADFSTLFSIWWRANLAQDLSTGGKVLLDKLLQLDFTSSNEVERQALKAFQSHVVAEILSRNVELQSRDQVRLCSKLTPIPSLLTALTVKVKSSNDIRDHLLRHLPESLFESLRSCDQQYRASAIDLIKALVGYDSFLLNECAVINDLPLDLHNARNISHRLRNLAAGYKNSSDVHATSHIESEAILSFFFGIATVRLQPVWTTVLDVIPKLIEKDAKGVCELAMEFVDHPAAKFTPEELVAIDEDDRMDVESPSSNFENIDCPTLVSVNSTSKASWHVVHMVDSSLEKKAMEAISYQHYNDVRSLGIKILTQAPQIAEREVVARLVPYLLHAEDEDDQDTEANDEAVFAFSDKVSLLELFGKLKHPENLPQFDRVYERYMYFLRSRHSPLQRLGFKCLTTVPSPEARALRKYSSNFEALLDDKRFRDELTSFVCSGENQMSEGSLHPDDRSAIIPFVVNVLYGRAQNSTKRNMRYAVLNSLHFLDTEHIRMFVELAHSHLRDSKATGPDMTFRDRYTSRKAQGYLTLMSDVVHHLKSTAAKVIPLIVTEGIFPILYKLDLTLDKALRQLVTKTLDEMLRIVPQKDVWDSLFPEIYAILVKPQMQDFSSRNHETPSTLMRLLLTVSSESELIRYLDDNTVQALTSCIASTKAKDPVIILVLRVIMNLVDRLPSSEVTRNGVLSVVRVLPQQMETELSPECISVAVETVNKIFSLGVDSFDEEVVHHLALVSFKTLQRPSRLVPLNVKSSLLLALSRILSSAACPMELIVMAYDTLAPLFRQFVDRDSRLHLSSCYQVFANRSPDYARVGRLIVELNSFDSQRLGEPDFTRRSVAFEEINESLWSELSITEWKPIMFNMLFFMRDPEELALRNNGKFAIMRLIESRNAPDLVKEFVLPAIKKGLRDSDDKFRRLYVDLLGQCAHFDVMPSLNVLLFRGDEEADFFMNVNHVQVHRRRRAVQRLGKLAGELDENVIAHYLLSIVENFAALSGSKNNDLNNLADDALHSITLLLQHVSVGQFKSVARRCVQNVLQGPEPAKLRRSVRVVTAVAQSTPGGIDDFVLNVAVAPLHRALTLKSNEHENLPDRIPLAVAIVHFLKSLKDEDLERELTGKLTSLCQLLRSKIPEMRDTVRQTLGRIIRILGPRYLQFMVTELRGALRKGGLQSHVLGFTVHSLLVELDRRGQDAQLAMGDTDDCAGLVFHIVMDDTFGSVGEEKDNEGYVTTSKEVKQHKSYDTAEILATWTSLSQFGKILQPMMSFLSETKLSSKNEHKVEEVLRRLAAGLHKNPQAATQDAVVMGYEIFTLCEKVINESVGNADAKSAESDGSLAAREQAVKESIEFFTVRLSSRDWYNGSYEVDKESGNGRYAAANLHLLQTFALNTLRSVMTSTSGGATNEGGKGLLTIANVKGLAPVILKGFESTFEDLNIASLRLAIMGFRLPIRFGEGDRTLELCAQRTLSFIESSPDTNSLICQASLKFLTMLIRHKPEFNLSTKAIAYILDRLRPDLEEPERQGTAISFIRAIFSKKVMLPQVYDVADTLSKVLVTNQSEHIRANCRAGYMQFLTTYPLGQSRLDRHLAALGANLRYAAPSGRLSVMEMIHSLFQKISIDQLEPTLINYFATLVLVLVADDEPACRQRAKAVIKELIDAVKSTAVQGEIVEYCQRWLNSLGKNDMLVRGGIEVAVMLQDRPWAATLRKQLHNIIKDILKRGQSASQEKVDWQLVYLALDTDTTGMIEEVEGVLLFPHPWVRSRATRVFGHYFKTTPKSELSLDLLVRVGYKLVRQIGAPRLTDRETLQIVKDLVFIIPLWDADNATMDSVKRVEDDNTDNPGRTTLCTEWLVQKLGSMVRTDVSAEDFIGSKTGAVQVLAALPSLLKKETTNSVAYEVIRSLYVLIDQLETEGVHPELRDIAQETMSLYDQTLGTTEYFKLYSQARLFVQNRRRDRRTKRAVETVADPEIAAQKRIKRNLHKRDVRKEKKRKFH